MIRRFLLVVALRGVLLPLTCGTAKAEDAEDRAVRPHSVQASLGAVTATTLVDDDGHWRDGGIGVTAGLDYGYRLLHALDVRIGAMYLDLGTAGPWPVDAPVHQRALLPWVGLRPCIAVSSAIELGVTVRFGSYLLWVTDVPDDGDNATVHTHVYSGTHFGLAPDVRIALTPAWALAITPEGMLGTGKDNGSVRGFYLRDQTTLFSIGASAGVVLRL